MNASRIFKNSKKGKWRAGGTSQILLYSKIFKFLEAFLKSFKISLKCLKCLKFPQESCPRANQSDPCRTNLP